MRTARLISATAALAAGLALFSPGGVSMAAWHDEVAIPGTTITSGELKLDGKATSVRVEDDAVIVEASSQLLITGGAIAADLSLQVTGFTPPNGSAPSVQIFTDEGRPLDVLSQPWRVGESHNRVTVTAWVRLPVAAARALTSQPRVTWNLTQTGGGWSSTAVHEVSLAGLWPEVPAFPGLACTPTGNNGLTMRVSWVWSGAANVTWQFYRVNAGDQAKAEPFDVTPRLVGGVYLADVSAQNANDKFTYFVRATWTDQNGQLRQQDSNVFGINTCGSGMGGTQ